MNLSDIMIAVASGAAGSLIGGGVTLAATRASNRHARAMAVEERAEQRRVDARRDTREAALKVIRGAGALTGTVTAGRREREVLLYSLMTACGELNAHLDDPADGEFGDWIIDMANVGVTPSEGTAVSLGSLMFGVGLWLRDPERARSDLAAGEWALAR